MLIILNALVGKEIGQRNQESLVRNQLTFISNLLAPMA